MEKYNYLDAIIEDAKNAILENLGDWNFTDRNELIDIANEELWADDSVTGNGSSSYYFNAWKAEEAICHNWGLVINIMAEGGIDASDFVKGPERLDVAIRCWLLGVAIERAIDELETEGKIEYTEEA